MKPKRRILSFLLAICLVVGLMPTAAFAAGTDTAKQLGISGISGYDSTNGYDYIYYGTWDGSAIKWRVLDDQTNTGDSGLFLLSDVLLGTGTNGDVYFDNSGRDSNVWQNSRAQAWCKDFAGEEGAATNVTNAFTAGELGAVLATTKSDQEFTSSTYSAPFSASEYILNGDKVFFLSTEEAENSAYGFTDDPARAANYGMSAGVWWLRSPFARSIGSAGAVDFSGRVVDVSLYGDWAARPAFNLNLNSVIFSSVLSGTSGQPGAEYKLTLQDGNMTITAGTITRDSGDGITVPYTIGGTNGGNATQVSLMVLDKEYTAGNTNGAKLVAYEKLADAGNTSGIFTLTNDMKTGSYYYYVVAEDVNGGNATDYASAPQPITIPSPKKYTVTVTNGTLSGGSTTGDYAQGETVTITADAALGGQQFKEWTVESGNITLADSTSATTTFTMSAEAVSVKANYEAIPATAPGITIQPSGGAADPGAGGAADPNTPGSPATPDTTYQIINGANGNWSYGSDEGLTIRGNGEFSRFTGVRVDGGLLDQSNYTAEEGSTIITLKTSYLNALAAGNHTVEILWTDGSAGTTFTINANASRDSALPGGTNKKDDVPKTGDSIPIVGLFILAGLSGAGLIFTVRKGRKNPEASGK